MRMERPRGAEVVAGIAVAATAVETGLLLIAQVTHRRTLEDFGAALPRFTELMLKPWVVGPLGVAPALVLAWLLLAGRRSDFAFVATAVGAVVVGAVLLISFFAAMRLPIVQLADEVLAP